MSEPKRTSVVAVTGGAAGIGLATARAFVAAGYRVAILDHDAVALGACAGEFADSGIAIECDVASWDAVVSAFEQIRATYGRLDALHSNAGGSGYHLFAEMPLEEVRRQIDVNLLGHLYCVKAALPLFDGPGAIVFTASVQGHLTLPGCVPYAAAKAGLMAAARALAVELGTRGIRVNSVSPGTIDTPMLRRDLRGMSDEKVEDFLGDVRNANALGRIGDAAEVAATVVFLCSDDASYITGEDVVVDGGYLRVKRF